MSPTLKAATRLGAPGQRISSACTGIYDGKAGPAYPGIALRGERVRRAPPDENESKQFLGAAQNGYPFRGLS